MVDRDQLRDRLPPSPLALGMAAIGRPGYINLGHGKDLGRDRSVDALRAHAHDVLDTAWDAGVRWFDAARSYGRAETFLAEWLDARAVRSDEVVVSSKWGYTYTGDWQVDADTHEVKDHSAATFDRQVAETRGLLGNHLDLYQIHSATIETGVLTDHAVLARLAALSDDGVAVGFTVSGPGQADAIHQGLEVSIDGRNPFSAVQATWNPLEPSAGDALREAHDAGLVVMVKEALANGRLTPRNDEPTLADARRLLGKLARKHEAGVDAVVLAAAFAQPFADVVLSGAAVPEHVRSNVDALGVTLDADDLEALAGLREPRADYWQHRSVLPWQ